MTFPWFVRRLMAGSRPRLVRRTDVHCPHTLEPVELDLVMRPSGSPALVLRCAARAECPPACDQACRHLAEAVTSPVRALIVLPAGSDVPDLVD